MKLEKIQSLKAVFLLSLVTSCELVLIVCLATEAVISCKNMRLYCTYVRRLMYGVVMVTCCFVIERKFMCDL